MRKINTGIKWRPAVISALFLFGIGVGLVQMTSPSFAAAKTWDGGGGDLLFSTAANWSGDTVPVNGDSLIFDVTGLPAGNTVLNNDMTGLSVTGINFSGNNADGDYRLDGNELSVSGTIVETTTDDHATNIYRPSILMNLNLTGNTSFQTVGYGTGTITNNGYALTMITSPVTACAVMVLGGSMVGSGAVAVQGDGFLIMNGNNSGFTGPITVASGVAVSASVPSIQSAASVTTTNSNFSIRTGFANATLATPLNLGGSFGVQSGVLSSGCSGGDDAGNTLTLTGAFSLTNNLVYTGSATSGTSDTTVTGAYASNGFALTTNPSSEGTITVPAEAPGAPTGLTPTAGNSQVGLSWTAPASNGGAAITDYVVQYKLTSSGTWLTFADGTSTGTTATVNGLTNGSSYDLRVLAVNSAGQSAPVTTTGVTPAATVSGAPTGLAGTPGNAQVALTWTAPASNGGAAITDYVVEYKLNSSGTWLVFADGTSATTGATVTSLTNGSSYDFRVLAVNGAGNSAYNTITAVTPVTVPGVPTGLTPTAGSTQVGLSWTAPASNGGAAITDYVVQYKLTSSGTWLTFADGTSTGTTATVTGLTNGSSYDFQVLAANSAGQSAPVTVTAVTPVPAATVSAAPTGLAGTPGNTQVALTWTVPASNGGSAITDYQVQYKLASSGTWLTFADGTSATTGATVTGLTNGSSYDFRVLAVNGVGSSAYNTITAVTPVSGVTAPSAPTVSSATTSATNGTVTVAWTAPASNGGSAITDYLIAVKLSSDSVWTTVPHAAFTGNSFDITTGLSNGSVYDFRISAINAAGTGAPMNVLGYTYTYAGASTGDGEIGGVGAPNTGIAPATATANPFVLIGLGISSAVLLLVLAFKRRASVK